MRIVLLEDNHFQAETIKQELCQALRLATEDVMHIKTESAFRERLSELVRFKPDVAVFDVMVLWHFPEPGNRDAPPADVRTEGYYTAGIRCWRLLLKTAPTIPVVFYTIVDQGELRERLEREPELLAELTLVSKSSDLSELVRRIRDKARGIERQRGAP